MKTRIVKVKEFGTPTPHDSDGVTLRLDYTGTVEAPAEPRNHPEISGHPYTQRSNRNG